MKLPSSSPVLTIALFATATAAGGLYPKSSPVLTIDSKNYDSLVTRSNYTTVLEFYAPWCGHCKNLKPIYEKAARNLDGLVRVAAINCDDEENKPLCGRMGVQGFPTLKIVRPRVKPGKPAVDDYQGARTAKAIVDAAIDSMNNHVKRVTDKDLDGFLKEKPDTAKAVLFSEKGTTGPLLKSIAIDFLDVLPVAQIRSKEKKAVETFGVDKFPTLVLIPGGDKDAIVYDGEMKKEAMVEFLSQAAEPNSGFAPTSRKAKSPKKESNATKQKKPKAKDESPSATTATTATAAPSEASAQASKPPPSIPIITETKLATDCLSPQSGICILAIASSSRNEGTEQALSALAKIAVKHAHTRGRLFPFYEAHRESSGVAALCKSLDLAEAVELVALHAKRGWWRRYEEKQFAVEEVEAWIDAIRMSEGAKKKLPEGVVKEVPEELKREKEEEEEQYEQEKQKGFKMGNVEMEIIEEDDEDGTIPSGDIKVEMVDGEDVGHDEL